MSRVKISEFEVTPATASMNTKTREQKRFGGTLVNWGLYKWWGATTGFVISGDVEGDEHWGNTRDLRTSLIVGIDLEKNEAETLNTVYKLGEEAPFGDIHWVD